MRQAKLLLITGLISLLFSSCELIGDIFKSGVYVGILIVVIILIFIIWIIRKLAG